MDKEENPGAENLGRAADEASVYDSMRVYEAISAVQAELEPFTPKGTMTLGGKDVRYVTKNQIVTRLKDLMVKHGLVCVYDGIAKIDAVSEYTVFWNTPGGKEQRPNLHLRYWVNYTLIHLNSGDRISRSCPGDAQGYDSKHTTVALAFAMSWSRRTK